MDVHFTNMNNYGTFERLLTVSGPIMMNHQKILILISSREELTDFQIY
jgi:hypothetical protein